MRTTKEVLDHHLKAFGAGDLDAVLSDYATDAIMFTPDGSVRGHEAMTPVFKAFIIEFGKPNLKFEIKRQLIEGEYVSMLWNADTADNLYEDAHDAFVVRNGQIVAHFISAKITRKHK